ncbi:MAG: TldD/PmbA family protein, partial [Tannerella sp.]|nr:TldD/PmbA family protein [Tannerella sp.]
MITNQQKELARRAMDYALKNGCQSVRLSLYSNSNTSFEIRDMKIDSLQQAAENGLSIQLFVDGRYGAISTNRLDGNELERFIKNGIESTRYLAEDRARTLPDASLYYQGGGPDLQLYDSAFGSLQPDGKVALAMKVCDEIMGKDSRIVSSGSYYSDGDSFSYRLASNGFEGESSASYYALAGTASIRGEGDARPGSYWQESSLFHDELKKDGIGARTLERALGKLGQKKVDSAKMPMVVDFLNSTRLLSPVISAIYGSAVQQKNSFLTDKKGEKVFGDRMTVVDEPHLVRSSGARYFDSEGIATRRMNVFDAGTLCTYYVDTYYANKLNTPQTAGSPSILTMPPGTKNLEGLVASVDKGVLVTGFNGGNCNPTTGDFSYGIEGFLIENGKTTQPLNEMNITGNMTALWNSLEETGNDARTTSSWRIPSLLFDG